MAQQLRALDVLAHSLGFVPSTHMAAHNHLSLQFQGISKSFSSVYCMMYSSKGKHKDEIKIK